MWQSYLIPVLTLILCTLLILDLLQTLQISLHPEKWYEINIILGEHPAKRVVLYYFLAVMIALGVLVYFAPVHIVYGVLGVGIAVELWCVWNNRKLGIPLTEK